MFHGKCVRWKISEQIGISMAYLHVFLIAMHEIDTAEKLYLEHFQIYIYLSFFAKIVNDLRKKAPSQLAWLENHFRNTPCSYTDKIWHYNKDETGTLQSSDVQVKH